MAGFDAEWFWWIYGWGAVLNNTWRPLSPRWTLITEVDQCVGVIVLQKELKEKLSYVASSAHKEVSPGSRSKHGYTVRDPTNQLQELFDPFLEAPAQYFKSGCKLKKAL